MPVTTETYEHQVTLIKQSFERERSRSPLPSPKSPLKSHAKSPTKIVLIQQGSPLQSSYLRMLRSDRTDNNMLEPVLDESGEIPTISYPFGSCICLVCGTMFTSASALVDHQEKCLGDTMPQTVEKTCPVCKTVTMGNDQCQHCQEAPQLTLVQEVPQELTQVQERDYEDHTVHASNVSALGFRDDTEICPLPPPPHTEPNKPLPYRIDFLLQSGVIKHARMNNRKDGAPDSSPLYFENKRPRKPRTHFTLNQIDDLEKVFVNKKYLSINERSSLAYELGLQEEQVKNWFQNRRSRYRKECKMDSPGAPSQVQPSVPNDMMEIPRYSMQYSLPEDQSQSPSMLPSFSDKSSDTIETHQLQT